MKKLNSISIGVVGLWHLGSVVSAAWSSKGVKTIGYDNDNHIVDNIKKGRPPVFEPGLGKLIKNNLKRGSLKFTNEIDSLSNCDYIFLTYDTPINDKDESDTNILFKTVDRILRFIKKDFVLIVSSQTPIGTCKDLRQIIKKNRNKSDIAYVPENLRLGDAIHCYLYPDRNIIGTSSNLTKKKVLLLFERITKNNILMSLESAELVKHGINSFLGLSVVFSNMLSNISEEKGANIQDVIKGIQSDERIGKRSYLNPGIGFSGGTLGRDLKNLEHVEQKMRSLKHSFFGYVYELNLNRKKETIKKIKRTINNHGIKNLSFFGITYKKNTSTLRRSIPFEIVQYFSKNFSVKIHDPHADWNSARINDSIIVCSDIISACKNTDLVIILTGWDHYKKFNWNLALKQMNKNIFFDAQNFFNEKKIIKMGFKYYGIGR